MNMKPQQKGQNLLPVIGVKVRFPTVVKQFHNLYLLRWGQSHDHVDCKILVEIGSLRPAATGTGL